MRIGIMTFYNWLNFGANLQGVSTYLYLKKHGHTPIFINYKSEKNYAIWKSHQDNPQLKTHLAFVNKYIENQTEFCHNAEQLLEVVKRHQIEAIIIGSDAVLQHHPLISRFKLSKKYGIGLKRYLEEQRFPNLFWGVGFADKTPCAMMSVSSQNSEYQYIGYLTKRKMRNALSLFRYISVRDTWTQQMVKCISGRDVPVTPDPVFAFNSNAPELIKSREEILEKYQLPEKYVLVCLKSQSLPITMLDELKESFAKGSMSCVAFPVPTGVKFNHHFDYEIGLPLPPDDWFALIKYASAYVGSNMHPIVVSLHNAVPCVSIDNWGRTNFFGKKIDDGSSKVEHIMREFGVADCHKMINGDMCNVKADEVVKLVESFPIEHVKGHALEMTERYNQMMQDTLKSICLK
ncbi:MAG: polysaccharide pyruvyl transferase family protein [Prevotella sp.]|nr:polysaccharide pyruvyl transferase family protein [Prevotella sp.]